MRFGGHCVILCGVSALIFSRAERGRNALRIDSVCGSCIRYCAESRMLQGAGFGDEMRQRSAEGACCIRALLAFAMGITSSCAAVSALFFSRAARGRNALRGKVNNSADPKFPKM